jgi:hypothetical protein
MRYSNITIVIACLLLTAALGCAHVQGRTALDHSFFSDMMYLQAGTSARVSSYDRTGHNIDFRFIAPGKTLKLADIPGAGCIRHMYFTIAGPPHYLRDLVLRMYWDDETSPSVEVPFGDFFGLGHERVRFYRSLLVTVNQGTGIVGTYGFNCYFPMPFSDGARLTLTNEGAEPVGAVWYHIDYEKLERIEPNVGRFHAQWRRENPTTPVGEKTNVTIHDGVNPDGKENYVILEAQGRGNLVGYFLNVDNIAGGWYGEGDDMIFIDGEEWPPSFHGTGSEEIFGGGACPSSEYAGPYTGFHVVGNPNYAGKVSMYRFFVTDPIRFQRSIRVTIEHGHANNYGNDYSSCAFWYQAEPHAPFPPLPPAAERRPRTGTDPHDVAFQKLELLQKTFHTVIAVASQKKIEIDPAVSGRAASAIHGTVPQAIEKRDYEAAIKESDECIAMLDEILEKGEQSEMR